MITCVACQCGNSDTLIRSKLSAAGYSEYMQIPIAKGKSKTNLELDSIPQHSKLNELREYLKRVSKYAIVIGYDEDGCEFVDMANGKGVVNGIDLEMILQRFA